MDLLARIRTHIHAHAHTCTGKRAHYAAKLTACLKINTYPQTHLLPPYYSTTHTTGKRARYATKDLLRSFGRAGTTAFRHANNDMYPRPNVALMGGRFGAGYPGELCVYLVVCAACVFV